eukprot:gnl/Hemi2/7587_TR2611_c0_g1_i1.p1 gnl/Hemi2/7587_TR2611_c0_g1~~gnl/Hemi2/7587_TR2611_c0_g1_i1.p1  ORF type:complete len:316 (-),score=12.23 gnl/Hemi2/7587_TR2611_c0_g1_i1:88-1035(-)
MRVCALAVYVLVASVLGCCKGRLLGGVVVPHGDFAFDPSLVKFENGSKELHQAGQEVGKIVADLAPDLILLTTPHGIALDNNFLFYSNSNGSGYALVGGDLQNPNFPGYKVPLDATLAPAIVARIVASLKSPPYPVTNVSTLLEFGDSEPATLRWGEVVPLSFIFNHSRHPPRIVVLSMPTRRYNHSQEMVHELLSLGAKLYDTLEALRENVVVVVSSDLAHTHLASGPYGYSAAAEPFDQACGRWAKTLDPEPLLTTAAELEQQALSCGFTGLVTLMGILSQGGGSTVFAPRLWANFHPTYYGMMVASFLRKLE